MECTVKAKYSHASGNRSAAKAVRYVSRRPEQTQEATREADWHDLRAEEGRTFGDEEAFREEANRRRDEKRESAAERERDLSKDKSPGSAQYVHVMVSPERDMTDEELRIVGREWTHDRDGNEHSHFGAIHRDTEHPHLHLLVARDKFAHNSQELQERKEATKECIRGLERERELERSIQHPERDLERDHERESSRRERELERERERDQERGLER